MRAIDLHAHIVSDTLIRTMAAETPEVAPRLRADGGHWYLDYPSGRRSGPVPPGMFDLAGRVADMDRQGVDVQALSVPPTHLFYGAGAGRGSLLAALHNDAMLQVARELPQRFRVLATLPLAEPDASLAEIARLRDVDAVAGVELGTNVAGANLDAEWLAPVWAALAEAGMVVVLHPDNIAGADRLQRHYLHNLVGNPTDTTIAAAALVFGGVLAALPTLRVVLLHGGGFVPYQLGRFTHGWTVRPEPRERLDEHPAALFARFHHDTLTHDREALRFLIDRAGADHVCLGSDYPFDMGTDDPVGQVRAATDDPATVTTMVETTPAALLERSPD